MKRVAMTLVVFLIPATLWAYQAIPNSCKIDRMAKNAKYAFCGVCTEAKEEVASRRSLGVGQTAYTFKVTKDLKGNIEGDTISFNQVGTSSTARWMPRYDCKSGTTEHCILLSCNEDSGRCAPTGLACGKFDVDKDETGTRRIRSSGVSNRALFEGVLDRNPNFSRRINPNLRKVVIDNNVTNASDFETIVEKLFNNSISNPSGEK